MQKYASVPQPTWCAECHLRVAPYAPHAYYRGRTYHRDCFRRWYLRRKIPRRKDDIPSSEHSL